jgi:hypothetical protein
LATRFRSKIESKTGYRQTCVFSPLQPLAKDAYRLTGRNSMRKPDKSKSEKYEYAKDANNGPTIHRKPSLARGRNAWFDDTIGSFTLATTWI